MPPGVLAGPRFPLRGSGARTGQPGLSFHHQLSESCTGFERKRGARGGHLVRSPVSLCTGAAVDVLVSADDICLTAMTDMNRHR